MLKDSDHALLSEFLDVAHDKAVEVAIAIGVPPQFWPSREYGALRVLEYGPTAITNKHTDFDLFTLMCYRNLPEYFKYSSLDSSQYKKNALLAVAKQLNSQVHFGELLEEIDPSTYAASPHEVVASGGPNQYSVVYFGIPPHDSVLPSGLTVGKWLEERLSRSRYER
jgi:isopenicillin N synthase-like dioxygenase